MASPGELKGVFDLSYKTHQWHFPIRHCSVLDLLFGASIDDVSDSSLTENNI